MVFDPMLIEPNPEAMDPDANAPTVVIELCPTYVDAIEIAPTLPPVDNVVLPETVIWLAVPVRFNEVAELKLLVRVNVRTVVPPAIVNPDELALSVRPLYVLFVSASVLSGNTTGSKLEIVD